VIKKKVKGIIKKKDKRDSSKEKEKDFREDGKEDRKEERRKSASFKHKILNNKEQEAFPGVPLHSDNDHLSKLLKGKQKLDENKPCIPRNSSL